MFIANRSPTRGSNCLDTVATTLSSWEYSTTVGEPVIADHCPVTIDIGLAIKDDTLRAPWEANYIHLTRIINEDRLHNFKRALQNTDWVNLISNKPASLMFDAFFECLKYNFDLFFPTRMLRPTKKAEQKLRASQEKSWYTDELADIRKLVVALHDRYRSAVGAHKEELYSAYLRAKGIYRRRVDHAKKLANIQRIQQAPNPCKAAWDLVSETSKQRSRMKCPASPDVFNGFILSEVARIVQSIPPTEGIDYLNFRDDIVCSNELVNWSPVSTSQIVKLIKSFKNSQSSDVYGMNVIVLKYVVDVIAYPLSATINACLESGLFPSALKIARTVPIFKKGDPELLSSYRPISLIPVLAKVFESIMKTQLVNHFEINKLFSDKQHGFRQQKSTLTAVSDLVSGVLDTFEEMGSMALVLADLSKAFECVPHQILLDKLKIYGVRGRALQLFHSYLEDRQQIVSIRGASSSPLLVKHGVPQGSVIGPVLFLIAINDITLLGDILLFADDATIHSGGKSPEEATARANDIFDRAKEWFKANKLSLNSDKTQELMLSLSRCRPNLPNMTVKLLGFTLDSKLLWKEHIDNVCKKLARVTYLLRRLKPMLMENHLVMVYHALFHSHLHYGLQLWGHASGCDVILRLQKKALRIISSEGYLEHCKPIFRRVGILTIYSQYVLLSLLHVKANQDSLQIKADLHSYSLRHGRDINIPFCRLSKKKDCFPMLAMKMFNRLPSTVRELEYINFKTRVKTWLLESPFYSLSEYFETNFENLV